MGGPGEERRRYPRASATFIVTFRLKTPLDVTLKMAGKEYAAVGLDIGPAGIGIDVEQNIPPDTGLRLGFTLVNETAADARHRERRFDLAGRVRYCRVVSVQRHHAGISFESVSVDDVAFIQRFIHDQALKAQYP